MADLSKALEITLKAEGGYSNHPADNGGETYRGITRVYQGSWSGWPWIDNYKKQYGKIATGKKFPELEPQVLAYYKADKWKLARGEELTNQDIANFVFDFVVNSGYARREINKAINKAMGSRVVSESNTLSNDSVKMLNNYPAKIYPFIVSQRTAYLKTLNDWSVFGKGWLNRIAMFPASIAGAAASAFNAIDQKKK